MLGFDNGQDISKAKIIVPRSFINLQFRDGIYSSIEFAFSIHDTDENLPFRFQSRQANYFKVQCLLLLSHCMNCQSMLNAP
jgi:hypothetical protein